MMNCGMTRRDALKSAVGGFGYLAMAGLSTRQALADEAYKNPLAPRNPHFSGRAKRVIMLFMQGGVNRGTQSIGLLVASKLRSAFPRRHPGQY